MEQVLGRHDSLKQDESYSLAALVDEFMELILFFRGIRSQHKLFR
jgi:hypothetical protein